MLVRVAVFAAILCILALAAPRVAPLLLSAAVPPRADTTAPKPPAVAEPPAPPPAARADEDNRPRASGRRITLRADGRGHFLADATINGRSIEVMVDTGATTVALTDATARRLGLRPSRADYTARISTANGVIPAAPLLLREVRIGAIAVRDVEAVVVSGEALPVNLLGMSFLGRLSKFEIAGGQLVLSP